MNFRATVQLGCIELKIQMNKLINLRPTVLNLEMYVDENNFRFYQLLTYLGRYIPGAQYCHLYYGIYILLPSK